MALAHTGVFRGAPGKHSVWVSDWVSFESKWQELADQGSRLTSLSASKEKADVYFAGTYGPGSGDHDLFGGPSSDFESKWTELSGKGLRLVGVAGWHTSVGVHFAGGFRAGTDAHDFTWGTWPQFQAKYTELTTSGLRLVSITAFDTGGVIHYGGAFRAGTGAHSLFVGQRDSFLAKWKELTAQGLRLVSVETYRSSGVRYFVGVFAPGFDRHYLLMTADWEQFIGKQRQLAQRGLQLVDVALSTHPCSEACLNHVVMPTGTYNYRIATTATHCEGPPGTCSPPVSGEKVSYRWPVDVEGAARFARMSAIDHDDQFLTLPFSDPAVERRGTWRYGNGGWHHAVDYSRDDSATFPVLSCAAGQVILMGWDPWSGNTVIVSHDVAGVQDAYRTIYMHLRNGRSNDCQAAWTKSVPTLAEPALSEFIHHLNETGCPQHPPRNPDSSHWGTDQQTLPQLVGQSVPRGAFLGWCGNTGPGGKRGSGGPNTHLHTFFCRRDPTNNQWYFFDPYGVYSLPPCYGAGVTDETTGPCLRYPVAWKGGKPQYP